jgi:UDP-N-acetylglucosamine 2-epimerase (non-hydrolysing)
MHRAENVDNPERLGNIIEALLHLEDITVIFPIHPRTVKVLKKFGFYNKLENAPHIKLTKPLGYLDFLLLLSKSKFIMTDSGGLQEEAITLNIPCMTLRYNTERPETVKAGGNILVGAETDKIIKTFNHISSDPALYKRMQHAPNPYGDGSAAENILKSIIEAYKTGKFDIKAPEQIAGQVERKFLDIHDDLSVSKYEAMNPGSRVMMVLHDHEIKFPYPDLNLKDKQVVLLIQKST